MMQSDRAPGAPERLVVVHLRAEEEVVPAADEAGRRDLLQPAPEVDAVPPRVSGGAVLEPVLIERHGLGDGGGVALPDRKDGARRRHHAGAPQLRAQHGAPPELLVLDLLQPRQRRLERERATGVHDGVAEVRRGHLEAQRPEVVRCVLRHRPLRHAEVAPAPHDEAAVEPGLGRHPLERGPPVGLLVAHRGELAPGSERPATALHDHLVPALRVQAAERAHHGAPVGSSDKHGRQLARWSGGVPAVGQELHAVGHLGTQATLDRDGSRQWRREFDHGCCDPAPHGH